MPLGGSRRRVTKFSWSGSTNTDSTTRPPPRKVAFHPPGADATRSVTVWGGRGSGAVARPRWLGGRADRSAALPPLRAVGPQRSGLSCHVERTRDAGLHEHHSRDEKGPEPKRVDHGAIDRR